MELKRIKLFDAFVLENYENNTESESAEDSQEPQIETQEESEPPQEAKPNSDEKFMG